MGMGLGLWVRCWVRVLAPWGAHFKELCFDKPAMLHSISAVGELWSRQQADFLLLSPSILAPVFATVTR